MSPVRSHWLFERMAQRLDTEAIADGEEVWSYRRVCARIEEWCDILGRLPGAAGRVVAFTAQSSAESCALLLAAAFSGCVAAPLPSGADARSYLEAAGADAVFEFAAGRGWTCSQLHSPERPPLLRALAARGTGGVIVFSSGTTGPAKAGLFDFAVLSERYREPRGGFRTLLFLQLDHLGGMHTMLHTLAHGGTLVISRDRDCNAVCAAIERHRAELLPATPTFLRMLALSDARRRFDLGSLRLITYGTEPMPPATLRTLTGLFPQVRFKQTYGLSELGVLPTRSRAPNSLWLQLGGVGCQTRVVDDVLWIRSKTAMLGYLNAPDPFDAEGWYNTEDAVETDGPYLRILGRTSDMINVGGEKVYPAEVESVLLEMENVREATVWGRPNPVTGQIVAARLSLAHPEDPDTLEARIHSFCRSRLAPHKLPLHIEIVEGGHHGRRFKKLRPNAAAGNAAAGNAAAGPQWPTPSS